MKNPYIVCDEQIPFARKALSRFGQVCLLPAEEIKARNIKSADCLIVRSVTGVGPELISGTRIKVVGSVTSGIDHVDTACLGKRGIRLISAPGSNADSVAEYVIASLLVIAEKIGINLKGLTVGIVGVGQVGSRVDRKCRALGMKTVLHDPPLQRRAKDPRYRPLREISQSDIITLHVPLTCHGRDATYHMAGEKLFLSMKKPFLLINTARGKVVDERALFDSCRRGIVSAVVLDVWPDEPDVEPDLLGLADIATPHIAGYSLDGKVKAVDMVYQGLCRHFKAKDDWSVTDLLPETAGTLIRIPGSTINNEDQIRRSVLSAYDPRIDDRKFRRICGLSPAKRGDYFERLRRDYPVRREFDRHRIRWAGHSPGFLKIMRKLGFRC